MRSELIFYGNHNLLEAPVFDKENDLVYFVAIRYNLIYSLNIKTTEIKSYKTNGPVGGVIVENDGIIEAEKSGIYKINLENKHKELITHISPSEFMRYNHIIKDSKGRILADIMGDEYRMENRGGLYSIDPDLSKKLLVSEVTVPNGIALTTDEKKLYFTDTPQQKVWEFDYDIETGNIFNQKTILQMEGEPRPDGLLCDKNGMLYVTEWMGSKISIYNTENYTKEEEILFDFKNITACCFGEDNVLYVTTAKSQGESSEKAGGLFRVELK